RVLGKGVHHGLPGRQLADSPAPAGNRRETAAATAAAARCKISTAWRSRRGFRRRCARPRPPPPARPPAPPAPATPPPPPPPGPPGRLLYRWPTLAAPGSLQPDLPLRAAQLQRADQQPHGTGARRLHPVGLQVTHRALAQTGAFRQLLLRQKGPIPARPQQ